MKRVSSLPTCGSTPSQRLVGVVAGALLLIGSTACGPSARASQENAVPSLVTPGAGDARGAVSTGASAQDVLKPYRDLVQCARQNGLPGLADPILDEAGQPAFTPETNRAIKMSWEANRELQTACGPLLAQLPARTDTRKAISQADMEQQKRFAQCLRQNGLPNIPDPDAVDGSIELPPDFNKAHPAVETCNKEAVQGTGSVVRRGN